MLKVGILALFAAALPVANAQQTVTISATQLQSNFNSGIGAGETAAIGAGAFDFRGQFQLSTFDSITITLTMIDGDTGLGANGTNETPYPPPGNGSQFGDDDFDVNSFSLVLDNINLGQSFLLNGFNSYDPETDFGQKDFITLTLTGTPSNMNALLVALQDGFLTANVLDSTGISRSNGIVIPNTQFDRSTPVFTTLSLTGTAIPEPSSAALLLGGTVLGGLAYSRGCVRRSALKSTLSLN